MPDSDNSNSDSHSFRRTLVEWGLVIGLLLFLQFTPQGKVMLSWLQRGVLATGLLQPDIEFAEEESVPASYEMELETLGGDPVSLEQFRGKVIFMNIWATWCAPCLAEMPYIQNLYDDVASENIVFVMISVDDEPAVARRYVEAKNYSFPVYRLRGSIPPPYTSTTIPTTYVISAGGRLATVQTGMSNVDTPKFRAFLRSLTGADATL